MRRSSLLALVFATGALCAGPLPARADCTDCAERYVEMAGKRRLQAEIDYLQPGDPLELDRTKRREREREDAGGRGSLDLEIGRVGWLVISGIVLAIIAVVVYQNAGGGLVSMRRNPDEEARVARAGGRGREPLESDALPASEAAFMARIEGMEDRRKALHLLSERLLSRASDEAGIRPGRSWTARESLRALPRSFRHLADLRHLNRHAELAWYGGRAVDEGTFRDCLDRARAVLGMGAAR